MKENNKQELSYFRLKLRSYMSEHHPEKLHDTEFITTRADMALTAYCDAVVQGFTHLEAESIASEVLYQGLHFSKYDTLVSVLENEFERELPAPLPEKLAPILLSNEAVQATFDKLAYGSFCRLFFGIRCSIAQIAGYFYSENSRSLYTFGMQSEA